MMMTFHSDCSEVCLQFSTEGLIIAAEDKSYICKVSPLEMVNMATGLISIANKAHAENSENKETVSENPKA